VVAGGFPSGISGGACEVLGLVAAQLIRRTARAATEQLSTYRFMV
jgi:hypothetical protein